jgi:hypothetical protein
MRALSLVLALGLGACADLKGAQQIALSTFQIAPPMTHYSLPPYGPTEMQRQQAPVPQPDTAAAQTALLNTMNAPLAKPAPQPKPDIQFDPHEAILAQQMEALVSAATVCDQQAIEVQLTTIGNRNRASILSFAEGVCGGALVNFIVAQKRPEKEARAFVHLQASQELDWYLAANR